MGGRSPPSLICNKYVTCDRFVTLVANFSLYTDFSNIS
jgi:hypothetical protein